MERIYVMSGRDSLFTDSIICTPHFDDGQNHISFICDATPFFIHRNTKGMS